MERQASPGLITLADIAQILRESRFLVLAVALLTLLVVGLAAFLMTQKYRAEVLLAEVVEQQGSSNLDALSSQLSGIASFAGVDVGGGGSDRATTIATLKSRSFTLQFIEEHDLKPILFAAEWDESAEDWISADDEPTDAEAVKKFDSIRTVSEDRLTGLIVVAVEWRDRHQAATWANQLIDDLNRTLRAKAISEAEKSSSYLRRELDKTSIVELQQAIFRLIEVQINRIMLANVREEYALKIIDVAVVPDEGDYSTPSRIAILLAGAFLGLLVGIFVALVRSAFRGQPQTA